MIELARGLGMQTAQPARWTALLSDCCTASGVTCDGSQRVFEIQWFSLGLNGIINGTAIPSSVTFFDLYNNVITGAIPNVLPSGLLLLYLAGNRMSGDLPSFPSNLKYLYLGAPRYPGNHFTGSLRLNRPIELYINDNWIADVVIQDSSVLATCDLSNNPLLGNPNIDELMCTNNDLYSAGLLPVTRNTTTVAKTTTTSSAITMSVFGTMTQMVSSEMTTVFGKSAKAFEFPTMTIVPLTTTMKAMHFTSSGILANVTQTATLRWTSIAVGTIQFAPMMRVFAFSLFMVARVLISGMLLTYVISKSPFKREFKKMMRKGKTMTTTTDIEF